MCKLYSGHVVIEKGKRWGDVIFLSGIHHEEDKEKIGDVRVAAWENEKIRLV